MTERPEIAPSREAGDLTTCDREPIHIPGSIQPHGALLSLEEKSLTVLQVSENAAEVFGRDASSLLGMTADELFDGSGEEILRGLRSQSLDRNPVYLGSFLVKGNGDREQAYRAIAHQYKGALLVELEQEVSSDTVSFRNLYPLVRSFMTGMQEVSDIPQLARLAAEEVRRITGFDRVLVYEFDPEWHGHVIAESRAEGFASYLDLWFPASDIPAQARELYRLNRLRLIADANYKPVPLVPLLDPRTNAPLDLSYASLRSVSPVHIEYLQNMNITASMSISIIQDGKLWGLISLHHQSARVVPFEVRVACDLLGQAFSTHLTARENQASYEHRLYLKSISTKLLGFMAEEDQFIEGLNQHPDELLAFGDATGAAVLFESKCTLLGKTPKENEVWRLVDWLAARGQEELYHTDCLPSAMADSEGLREAASGVLAISISKLYRSYVLWFRPEVVQTVKWSGDPRKPVEPEADGTLRLHPRKSFETWKETVRGRSLPWRQSEIESAAELRNAVVGVVLRKAEELAALSAELQRSNKELEAFSYSVSHDLRAPFRHIVGYSELLRDHFAPVMDATGERFISTITGAAESAGMLVDNLLNFARVGRAKLHIIALPMGKLVNEVQRELMVDEERPVVWEIGELPTVQGDPILLRLVWQNLVSNALKYTRHSKEPKVTIGASEDEHEYVFFVRDNGIGFRQQYANKLFGVFQRLHSQEEFEGTGIGLANVRRAIGKHGGRTWAEGELGKGATFYFSLPRRVHPERGSYA